MKKNIKESKLQRVAGGDKKDKKTIKKYIRVFEKKNDQLQLKEDIAPIRIY